ncbi:MAG: hypothetical protein WCP20_24210 [Desulfuromonadales bacterium]
MKITTLTLAAAMLLTSTVSYGAIDYSVSIDVVGAHPTVSDTENVAYFRPVGKTGLTCSNNTIYIEKPMSLRLPLYANLLAAKQHGLRINRVEYEKRGDGACYASLVEIK